MPSLALRIRGFAPQDHAPVVALWHACGLIRPWNDPHKDIERKCRFQPELFLVMVATDPAGGEVIVGTAMAGYDGHRGSVYYLAVDPQHQKAAIGRQLMAEVERRLLALGCPKVNVMVRTSNAAVRAFYDKLGYVPDEAFSLGKRLIPDV